MDNIITELFYQYFKLSDTLQEKQRMSTENQKLEIITEELLRTIPKEKHDLFFTFEKLSNEIAIIETEAIFKFGVKVGMQLQKEIDELLSDTE